MTTNYVHSRYLDGEERYEIFIVKSRERPHLIHWKPERNDSPKCFDGNTQCPNEEKKIDDSSLAAPSSSRLTEETQLPPPLTDGCDLPGWRSQCIAPCMSSDYKIDRCDSPLGGTLNVGAGSTLFRRESQLPFICSNIIPFQKGESNGSACHVNNMPTIEEVEYECLRDTVEHANKHICWWYSARERLRIPPPTDSAAPVVEHDAVSVLIDFIKANSDGTEENSGRRKVTLFSMEYEMKNRPVKILGATKGWSAMPCYDNIRDLKYEKDHAEMNHDYVSEAAIGWMDIGQNSKLLSDGGKGGWT